MPGGERDVPEDEVARYRVAPSSGSRVGAGFPDGTFQPGRPISRAQFAAMVHRAATRAGADLPAGDPERFSDVPANHTHAAAINALAAAGVVHGFDGGVFRPGAFISRAQAASMMVRAYEAITGDPLPAGPDAFGDDDGSTHEANINAAAAVGWVQGVKPGQFAPKRDITRGQTASVVARMASTLVEEGHLDLP